MSRLPNRSLRLLPSVSSIVDSFWTKKVVTGPRWVSEPNYSFTRIPIFVRPNTILLLGPEGVTTPDYEYAEIGLEVQKYELEGGKVSVQVPTGKGTAWAGEVSIEGKGDVQSSGVKLVLKTQTTSM